MLNVEQAIVTLAWALGAIFLLAAFGKIAAPDGRADLILATGEGSLGLLLVGGVSRPVVSVLVVVTAATYCIYAFAKRSDEDCACFGRRLPASSASVQRARNTLLAILAAAYLLLVFVASVPSAASVSVVSAGTGLLAGLVIVVAPWLLEWALMK